jgi:hypothetical protein
VKKDNADEMGDEEEVEYRVFGDSMVGCGKP